MGKLVVSQFYLRKKAPGHVHAQGVEPALFINIKDNGEGSAQLLALSRRDIDEPSSGTTFLVILSPI